VIASRVATVLAAALCVAGAGQLAAGAVVPAKAVVAQILLDRAFERSVTTRQPQKPWPWADMAPAARLAVPRLGVTRIVLSAGSGQAMAFGPTLLPRSAALGTPGTSVIAAHRDTHFAFLRDVRPGDLIAIQSIDGVQHRYRAARSEVVRNDRFAVAAAPAGNTLVLSTCYPFDAVRHGPLRYVLYAVPID
jgi:sortase A